MKLEVRYGKFTFYVVSLIILQLLVAPAIAQQYGLTSIWTGYPSYTVNNRSIWSDTLSITPSTITPSTFSLASDPFRSFNLSNSFSNLSLWSNSFSNSANNGSIWAGSSFNSANNGSIWSNSLFNGTSNGSIWSNSLFNGTSNGSIWSNSLFNGTSNGSIWSNSSFNGANTFALMSYPYTSLNSLNNFSNLLASIA
jgi:hypothetical protein